MWLHNSYICGYITPTYVVGTNFRVLLPHMYIGNQKPVILGSGGTWNLKYIHPCTNKFTNGVQVHLCMYACIRGKRIEVYITHIALCLYTPCRDSNPRPTLATTTAARAPNHFKSVHDTSYDKMSKFELYTRECTYNHYPT
jgi:hypothetical protein